MVSTLSTVAAERSELLDTDVKKQKNDKNKHGRFYHPALYLQVLHFSRAKNQLL